MATRKMERRQFMKAAVVLGSACTVANQRVYGASEDDQSFKFEVVRTDEEWQSMFDEETYDILRHGATEWPKSSKLWNDYREGKFSCQGCDLVNFESTWRAPVKRGWVFFEHSVPNTILTGIDGVAPDGMADESLATTIQALCRRCGSHMGHILYIEDKVLYCINGRSLKFHPA